ncbi:MAG: hypothetical protein HY741_03285 [Chloroflexi bacterium]|nr:hypothetical protein [Chloroflexota bacterium]
MTGPRIVLLTLLALVVGAIGLYLALEPAPAEPLDEVAMRTQAIAASSASTGLGVLVPKMALAAQIVEPRPGEASVLVAFARKTKTPAPTPEPTDRPTIRPTDQPTIRPTALPPTAIPYTLTPAPTEPPRPTRTPRPTKTPAPTRDPNAPEPTLAPPTEAPPSGPALTAAIGSCGAITKPGGYYLTGALRSDGDCLNIRASNVVLDCKGNSIQGASFNGVGVVVRKLGILGNERPKNIEIRNCTVSGYRHGIYVEGSSGIHIHHNVLTKNYDDVDGRRYGIFLGMVEGGGFGSTSRITALSRTTTRIPKPSALTCARAAASVSTAMIRPTIPRGASTSCKRPTVKLQGTRRTATCGTVRGARASSVPAATRAALRCKTVRTAIAF